MPGAFRELRAVLSTAVTELDEHNGLTVVDLGHSDVVVWELHRDHSGTPRGEMRWTTPWDALPPDDAHADHAIEQAVGPGHGASPVLVCTDIRGDRGEKVLERLGRRYPQAPSFTAQHPVDRTLLEIIASQPLTRSYELVALRRRTSGNLDLVGSQLFPIGARRGDSGQVRLRCLPSDAHGIVFAVAAYAGKTGFQLVSAHAAKLPPGVYDVTAELRRPGLVRFHGLPAAAALVREPRAWPAIVSSIPDRIESTTAGANHLVCAVEISGLADRVALRLSAIARVIEEAAAELSGDLRVSVLSYGPHRHQWNAPEVPVRFAVWSEAADQALAALHVLEDEGPAPTGYPSAAQIECVLAALADRLERSPLPGRTALLLVGARPACPPRSDLSMVLPCPFHKNWRTELERLRRRHGVAVATIQDRGGPGPNDHNPVWTELGAGPPADLDVLEAAELGVALKLLPQKWQRVPLPLLEPT